MLYTSLTTIRENCGTNASDKHTFMMNNKKKRNSIWFFVCNVFWYLLYFLLWQLQELLTTELANWFSFDTSELTKWKIDVLDWMCLYGEQNKVEKLLNFFLSHSDSNIRLVFLSFYTFWIFNCCIHHSLLNTHLNSAKMMFKMQKAKERNRIMYNNNINL